MNRQINVSLCKSEIVILKLFWNIFVICFAKQIYFDIITIYTDSDMFNSVVLNWLCNNKNVLELQCSYYSIKVATLESLLFMYNSWMVTLPWYCYNSCTVALLYSQYNWGISTSQCFVSNVPTKLLQLNYYNWSVTVA